MIPIKGSEKDIELRRKIKHFLDLRAEHRTEALQFSNVCHDPETGRFCDTEGKASEISPEWHDSLKKATTDLPPQPKFVDNYWLTPDGRYAPVEAHADVFSNPNDTTQEGYQSFVQKTGAVRVIVGGNGISVELYAPATEVQRTSLADLAVRQGRLVLHTESSTPYDVTRNSPDYDTALRELRKANFAARGVQVPPAKEFAKARDRFIEYLRSSRTNTLKNNKEVTTDN